MNNGKYTPELVASICNKLENGLTKRGAAILNGIDETTFYDWVKQYPQFSQSVEDAIEKYKEKLINIVKSQLTPNPENAASGLAKRS